MHLFFAKKIALEDCKKNLNGVFIRADPQRDGTNMEVRNKMLKGRNPAQKLLHKKNAIP